MTRLDPTALDDATIDAIAVRVLDRIRAALTRPRTYSSRKGHAPDGYSAREWSTIARELGVKRGRWYYVTPEQLDAFEIASGRRAPPVLGTDASAKVVDEPWSPEVAARALGLRPTR